MAQAYICDACGIAITNPYSAKMKEFYVGCFFEGGGVFPSLETRRMRVHLCNDCYNALYEIAKKKRGGNDGK